MYDSECPIDIKELRAIMGDDDLLLKECLDDFARDCPAMLDQIRSAIFLHKSRDLEYAAHAFKGSLAYLAARRATDAATRLETMGRDGDLLDAVAVFSGLMAECLRIREFIERY